MVAPINVKRLRSIRIDRALGPFPIRISNEKSSIAEYKTSSITRLKRWISSMNNTSPLSRFVRIAARSPCFSMTGPLVIWIFASISWAMTFASVVFPSPGGPTKRTWSKTSPLILQARMEICKLSFILFWPMYSSSAFGLNTTICWSSTRDTESTKRSVSGPTPHSSFFRMITSVPVLTRLIAPRGPYIGLTNGNRRIKTANGRTCLA